MQNQHKDTIYWLNKGYLLQVLLYMILIGLGFYFYNLDIDNFIAFQQSQSLDNSILYRAEMYYYACLTFVLAYSVGLVGCQIVRVKTSPNFILIVVLVGLILYLYQLTSDIEISTIKDSQVIIAGCSLVQIFAHR